MSTEESSGVSKRRRTEPLDAQVLLDVALDLYTKLPKKGKPQPHESVTLAAVIVTHPNNHPKVISLATGSKCLPSKWASNQRLNDSHAEVLARRAAIDYALHEISFLTARHEGTSPKPLLFEWDEDLRSLRSRSGMEMHLVVTRPPCGDASVINGATEGECFHMTGAKPLQSSACVPSASSVEAGSQLIGCLRRKPGKGESTASMSCSDKLLRWSFLGFQGKKALTVLPCPLYFSSIIACAPSGEMIHAMTSAFDRCFVQRGEELKQRLHDPFKYVYSYCPNPLYTANIASSILRCRSFRI